MRIDDLRPYAFRTHDGGKTWQSISAGLPIDSPVNAVREDTERKGMLFAATETAVWVSQDDGDHWESLQINLPHTSMRDLAIQGNDLILGTHGRSIWILDDISPLRQMTQVPQRDAQLLRPAETVRVERSTWTDTPIPPDEPLGQNPPSGAIVDYFLPREPKDVVTLEVLDSKSEVVRRYRSDDPPDMTDEELARELIPRYWIALPRILPKTAGMHRWIWDLRYPAPTGTTHGFPISAMPHSTPRGPQGPVALPGNYVVRLTVDGRRFEQPLVVQADPRVTATAPELARQFALASKLAALLTDSSKALLGAESQKKQLEEIKATGATEQAVKTFRTQLSDIQLTEVQAQIGSLYAQVSNGSGAPTAAALRATQTAQEKLTGLLQRWKQLESGLPALNKTLHHAGLPVIRTDAAPPRDLNAADED
jgi:hypothetical protein